MKDVVAAVGIAEESVRNPTVLNILVIGTFVGVYIAYKVIVAIREVFLFKENVTSRKPVEGSGDILLSGWISQIRDDLASTRHRLDHIENEIGQMRNMSQTQLRDIEKQLNALDHDIRKMRYDFEKLLDDMESPTPA